MSPFGYTTEHSIKLYLRKARPPRTGAINCVNFCEIMINLLLEAYDVSHESAGYKATSVTQ